MKTFVLSFILISIGSSATGSERYSIASSPSPEEGDPAITSQPVLLRANGQYREQGRAAAELGNKVLAVMHAIRNPEAANAIQSVTDLGHDQRYYIMVRGWLQYQLDGDKSILKSAGEQTPIDVIQRVQFLEKAIRALDLE